MNIPEYSELSDISESLEYLRNIKFKIDIL